MTNPEDRHSMLEREFPLTDAEKARVQDPRLPSKPEDWRAFAGSLQVHILSAYRDGDIDFRQMIEIARNMALGCTTADRVTLLGIIAEKAIHIRQRTRNAKKPAFPIALRHAAIDLVLWVKETNPKLPLARSPGSVVEVTANEWLPLLGLFPRGNAPKESTLYSWYLEHMKGRDIPLPRGRPKRAK